MYVEKKKERGGVHAPGKKKREIERERPEIGRAREVAAAPGSEHACVRAQP